MSNHVVSRTCTGDVALKHAAITSFPHLLRCGGDKCKSCKPRVTFINFSLGCTGNAYNAAIVLYRANGSGTPAS